MIGVVEKLGKIGLTEYEAKAYMGLLNVHLSTATQLSEKSGVPRTKIYSVLESLAQKGWVKIYSGIPLLFKAVDPHKVFEKIKEDYTEFMESVEATLTMEVNDMICEKFVIKNFDVGLRSLKDEMKKAKTIWINNATADFVEKMKETFSGDKEVRVLLFPGEKPSADKNVQFKEAEIKIVCMVRNKEVPAIAVTLDETRIFNVFEDPFKNQFIVDEMLYDECAKCLLEWNNLGWGAA
jgi:sugar-specific transcriptional regulator TrmB